MVGMLMMKMKKGEQDSAGTSNARHGVSAGKTKRREGVSHGMLGCKCQRSSQRSVFLYTQT